MRMGAVVAPAHSSAPATSGAAAIMKLLQRPYASDTEPPISEPSVAPASVMDTTNPCECDDAAVCQCSTLLSDSPTSGDSRATAETATKN
jgi:hypothetical protein